MSVPTTQPSMDSILSQVSDELDVFIESPQAIDAGTSSQTLDNTSLYPGEMRCVSVDSSSSSSSGSVHGVSITATDGNGVFGEDGSLPEGVQLMTWFNGGGFYRPTKAHFVAWRACSEIEGRLFYGATTFTVTVNRGQRDTLDLSLHSDTALYRLATMPVVIDNVPSALMEDPGTLLESCMIRLGHFVVPEGQESRSTFPPEDQREPVDTPDLNLDYTYWYDDETGKVLQNMWGSNAADDGSDDSVADSVDHDAETDDETDIDADADVEVDAKADVEVEVDAAPVVDADVDAEVDADADAPDADAAPVVVVVDAPDASLKPTEVEVIIVDGQMFSKESIISLISTLSLTTQLANGYRMMVSSLIMEDCCRESAASIRAIQDIIAPKP